MGEGAMARAEAVSLSTCSEQAASFVRSFCKTAQEINNHKHISNVITHSLSPIFLRYVISLKDQVIK